MNRISCRISGCLLFAMLPMLLTAGPIQIVAGIPNATVQAAFTCTSPSTAMGGGIQISANEIFTGGNVCSGPGLWIPAYSVTFQLPTTVQYFGFQILSTEGQQDISEIDTASPAESLPGNAVLLPDAPPGYTHYELYLATLSNPGAFYLYNPTGFDTVTIIGRRDEYFSRGLLPQFTASGVNMRIGDVEYAAVSNVPEPTTWTMLVCALAGLWVRKLFRIALPGENRPY